MGRIKFLYLGTLSLQNKKFDPSNFIEVRKTDVLQTILKRKRVELHVLDQNVNPVGAADRLLFNMLGVIAQFGTGIRTGGNWTALRKPRKRVCFDAQKKLLDVQIEEL